MQIKAARLPELQKIKDASYQGLKRQLTLHPLSQSLNGKGKKIQQYLQVNYLKDFVYKISPEKFTRVPLLKEEENLRDYLFEVKNDQNKLLHVNNQLKDKFFRLFDKQITDPNSKIKLNNHKSSYSLNQNSHKNRSFQMFDPISYLEGKKQIKQLKQIKKVEKQQMLSFLNQVESVNFLDQDPNISNFPPPLLSLKKLSSNPKLELNKLSKTQRQFNNSINDLLQKSVKYQSPQKGSARKLKNYKSRNQLNKANQKMIKNEREHILSLIEKGQKKNPSKTHRPSATSVNQIPAKQKYNIDFISYLRTKTKIQLDKLIYEKLIKKPEKNLEKFQQFILRQVKFQNQENKHQIERFFIKMREQFRRVQKYGKEGSKFDWRSKSLHLEEVQREQNKLKFRKVDDLPYQNMTTFNKSVQLKNKKKINRKALLQSLKRKQHTKLNAQQAIQAQVNEEQQIEENKQQTTA